MNKNKIRKKLINKLGYKAPEQLRLIMGFVGEIDEGGNITIRYPFPKEGYTVGLLKGGGRGLPRMAILWDDKTYTTFG